MLADKTIIAIFAMDEHRGVWYQGHLPAWKMPEDMAHFRRSITDRTIVMGRKTYESLRVIYGTKYPDIHWHPKAKHNIIISRQSLPGAHVAQTVQQAVDLCPDDELRVIGGTQVFQMFWPYIDQIYLTKIAGVYPADTYLPPFEDQSRIGKSWPAEHDDCMFSFWLRHQQK